MPDHLKWTICRRMCDNFAENGVSKRNGTVKTGIAAAFFKLFKIKNTRTA